MKVPVNTNQSFLKGDIKISVSIGNFEEQYQQSFVVRDRISDTTGGDKKTINPDNRGQYRLHASESDGRFEVKSDKMLDVDLLVVGGGGSGGGNYSDDTEVSGGDGESGIVLIRVGLF